MLNTKPYKDIIIIYHGKCLDGTTGAWVLQNYFYTNQNINLDNIHLIPQPPQCPNLIKDLEKNSLLINPTNTHMFEGYNILFVDVCPSFEVLQQLIQLNQNSGNQSRIEIYDHHESNKNIFKEHLEYLTGNIKWVFCLDKCGCQIVWDEFIITENLGISLPRPWFVDYVADGDLWKWELPEGKLIYNILYDNFNNIDKINELFIKGDTYFKNEFRQEYLEPAKIIQNYKQQKINNYANSARHYIFKIDNTHNDETQMYNIWFCQCLEYELVSELGNQLTKKKIKIKKENNTITNTNTDEYDLVSPDFVFIVKGIKYSFNSNVSANDVEFSVSLRSNNNIKPDINVSKIASLFGGGGHPQASGCTFKYSELVKHIGNIR